VAASKRRVRWRFGFSDPAAIQQGLSSIDCRGAEHEVVLLFSLTSGKQRVLADGVEVHFGSGSRLGDLEFSWTMQGGHELKIIAHATPALLKSSENSRQQFNLIIDGCPFEDLPQIYELGREVPSLPAKPRARSTPQLYRMGSCPISPTPSLPPNKAQVTGLDAIRKPGPPRRAQSLPMQLLSSLDGDHNDDSSTTASISPCSSYSVLNEQPYYHQTQETNVHSLPFPHATSHWPLSQYQATDMSPTAAVTPESLLSASWSFSFSPQQEQKSLLSVDPKNVELENALNTLVNLNVSSPLQNVKGPKIRSISRRTMYTTPAQ
jgi:hypothetical protein